MVEGAPSNIECLITTRDYSELNKVVSKVGLKHTQFGRHGGGDLLHKLRASVERQAELISFVESSPIDFSFSFISPEAARVSFGLGIKHFICSDSPHANAPSRLAVPLSESVFTPFPIDKTRWSQYGIKQSQVLKYHSLDPWVWLKREKIRASTRVTRKVIIRLEESFASYFKQGKGLSSILCRLVHGIKAIDDFEIILVPRYDEQREWVKKEFGAACTVPQSAIDGPEEISRSDLLIGGGATMTQEAALLGVPNISYFPSAKLDVFTNFYFPKKLSIEANSPSSLLSSTFSILKKIDSEKLAFGERAEKETSKFEDPIAFIFQHLVELTEKMNRSFVSES